MNNQEFKLSFNHPVKEIYSGITSDEIKYIINKIREENNNYNNMPIPNDVFSKYYIAHLENNPEMFLRFQNAVNSRSFNYLY